MPKELLTKKARVGIYKQPKTVNHWDAVGLTSSIYRSMPYEPGVIPEIGVTIGESNYINRDGLHEDISRIFLDKLSGLHRIPFQGVAQLTSLAPHFVSNMQFVTESGVSPYSKSITSAYSSNPDFRNNEGHLYTVAFENFVNGSLSDTHLLYNALVGNLSFIIEPNNEGLTRLARIQGTWVGNKISTPNEDVKFTGTWVNFDSDKYIHDSETTSLAIIIDGVTYSIDYRRFALILDNQVQPQIRHPFPLGYTITPNWMLEIDIPYYAENTISTYKIPFDFLNKKTVSVTLTIGSGLGLVLVFAPYCYMVETPRATEGDYHALKLRLKLASSGASMPLVVSIADGIDYGY